jgi:hypothetical protein
MTTQKYSDTLGLSDKIDALHTAITKKFPVDGMEFDAWYTKQEYVFDELLRLGRDVAKRIREEGGFNWSKGMDPKLKDALSNIGVQVDNWEDGPDGALTGIAIVLVSWLSNQTTAKTLYDSKDQASPTFKNVVMKHIKEGIKLGEKKAKQKGKKTRETKIRYSTPTDASSVVK